MQSLIKFVNFNFFYWEFWKFCQQSFLTDKFSNAKFTEKNSKF